MKATKNLSKRGGLNELCRETRFSTSLVVRDEQECREKVCRRLLIFVVTPRYLEGQLTNCPWTSTATCLNHGTA